jgi:hypothetical protein
LDSKFNAPEKTASSGQSQNSSEKKVALKQLATEVLVETQLTPIQEQEVVEVPPEPVPSKFKFLNTIHHERFIFSCSRQ